jgi:hypothetical protein
MLFAHRYLGASGMSREEVSVLPERDYGQWCDHHGVALEKLYGTDLHYRGAAFPDLGLTPIPREELNVLKAAEVGDPNFTIDGWLKAL